MSDKAQRANAVDGDVDDEPGPAGKPDDPSEIPAEGWWGILKRTVGRFMAEKRMDGAAALTYYAFLSMFPAFIALVALLGLFGSQNTVDTLLDAVSRIGSSQAAETFRGPAENVVSNQSSSGIFLVLGIATALWSASGYIGAFTRANNDVWEVGEGRPFWKLKPLQLLITLVMIIGFAVIALALAISGPIASDVGDAVGLSSTAVLVWRIAKWPVMLALVILLVALLYHATPNVKQPKFRWISPGAAFAIVVWLIASAALAFYAANFGSYNETYGSLASVVILLLWLWITNIALLIGVQFDAEMEREREIQAGVTDAREQIQLPERDATDEDVRPKTSSD